MDVIASHLPAYKGEGFSVVKFDGKTVRIEDGNDNLLVDQTIEYTDFPLDEITLYVVNSNNLWVIMLTSEY